MSSQINSIGTLNLRRMAGIFLILAGVTVTMLFTAGQVSAETPAPHVTPPVATAPGGVTQASIKDDGQFQARGKGVELGPIATAVPVLVSLRIGDDVGQATVPFGAEPSRIEVRRAKDLFGTVVSVSIVSPVLGLLTINTGDGSIEVPTDADTEFKLPRKRDAQISDLVEGDLVAVSLEERDGILVAHKVFLVPSKTRHRHISGKIVSLVIGNEITIQPPGVKAAPVTFNITPNTKINLRGGVDHLAEGLFVVVLGRRDALTGELSPDALEIIVTLGPPPVVPNKPSQPVKPPLKNTAEIRGVLQGLDAAGNWIINGTVVTIDPDTEIAGGLVVGQLIDIEVVLRPDGTTLALRVEEQDGEEQAAGKTDLEGYFEGVDNLGIWIIGGTRVAIGPDSDTDGLPASGQLVKVKARLQKDGSLLAREVENRTPADGQADRTREVKLRGTFQGTEADGNLIISGKRVVVDALTRLQGNPAVGQRVAVEAVIGEGGVLLAKKVKGGKSGPIERKREAK